MWSKSHGILARSTQSRYVFVRKRLRTKWRAGANDSGAKHEWTTGGMRMDALLLLSTGGINDASRHAPSMHVI
jgi:hypothetical protein